MEQGNLFGIEGLTERGWLPPERDLDFEKDLKPIFGQLKANKEALEWGFCDFLNWLEDNGDEGAYQLVEESDWESPTVRRGCRVARQIPIDERLWSIWKHEEILYAPPEIREEFTTGAPIVQTSEGPKRQEPTVQQIRDRRDEYEGKHKAETLHAKHCAECGAEAWHWKNEPSTVRTVEDQKKADAYEGVTEVS